MDSLTDQDRALLWKPEQLEGITLLKARFHKFCYKKHTHDEYAIGVIEAGTQKFHHHRGSYLAPAQAIITVNPDEVHDGQAALEMGYQYRMSYIDPGTVDTILTQLEGATSTVGYFHHPVTFDLQLSHQLLYALVALDQGRNNGLEAQSCFFQAIGRLFLRHGHYRDRFGALPRDSLMVRDACEYIRQNASENISLDEIARCVNLSRYHFLRVFKATTGLPPHAYLIQQRLRIAKNAIESGSALAEAALLAGFSDQSHLTRWFKSAYGLTPGQYQRALQQ